MVKLTKIYTRGGDKGRTSLADGERVPKHDPRVAAYGAIDEANSIIGVVRLHVAGPPDEMLKRIQNDLFDLGADLATPLHYDSKKEEQTLRIKEDQVRRLEVEIDLINKDLSPLKSFILPGGTTAAAYLHLARTVVRRAEILVFTAAEESTIGDPCLQYVNRLSDHLFVLARHLNSNGENDVLWIPGNTQSK